jgi:hypothetical protein
VFGTAPNSETEPEMQNSRDDLLAVMRKMKTPLQLQYSLQQAS